MKFNCHGCGIEKDTNILEIYPYPEDSIIDDEPIQPLFEIDCQPWNVGDREEDIVDRDWRRVTVCHKCFHNLEPDMWISRRCWESLNPTTLFENLPFLI